MVNFPQIGTAAAAALAPFMLTANAGALADECKKAPAAAPAQSSLLSNPSQRRAGVASRDWDLINLSSPPVLIADAGPAVAQAQPANCPPRDGVDAFLDSQRRLRNGLREEAERLRSLPPVPGS
jgi:hypothetical protein